MIFLKILLTFLFISNAWTQDNRWIDLEWESVAEAKGYEIELFQDEAGKKLSRGKYKTDIAAWSHAVTPGKYFLRMRSLDSRGVPGEWTSYIPLKVKMPNPQLLRPIEESKIEEIQIDFEWASVAGAAVYQLVIRDDQNEVVHNVSLPTLSSSTFLEALGTYTWAVFALEAGEAIKTEDEWTASSFKKFTRVGSELDAPIVKVEIKDKVSLSWYPVRGSLIYETDYLPPIGKDKNRRFNLKRPSLEFAKTKLKEGVTTLTVKATAKGYKDSPKSMVQILRSGNKYEVQDIIQGKKEEVAKEQPTRAHWRDQLFLGVALAKYTYSSSDVETDTQLDQKSLTGLGLDFEWHSQPRLNSWYRKLDFSFLNLSSGIDSGHKIHAVYSLSRVHKWNDKKWMYGLGVAYLNVPAFMGNRFEDDISVENSSSLGPDLNLGYIHPFNNKWSLQANLNYSYQLFSISSERDGDSAFGWLRMQARVLHYFTKKEAFFMGINYQRWEQKWTDSDSSLGGAAINIGLKAGF